MLFQRLIREVSVDAAGRLQLGGRWELEPARGESRLHRDLAALATASDQTIARFASTHGLLRHRASAYLNRGSKAYWADQVMRFAQRNWTDTAAAIAWARGERSDLSPAAHELAAWFRYVAGTVPRDLLLFWRALVRDEPFPIEKEVAGRLMRGLSVPISSVPDTALEPTAENLALAADILEPFAYALTTERTPGLRPDDPPFGEMTISFLASAPDALALLTADPGALDTVEESVEEWRTVARDLAPWIRLLTLLHAARHRGVRASEGGELRRLLAELLGWEGPADLRAAELADRCLPLCVLRIEQALTAHGSWPPSRQVPLPTYVRALLALWREATGTEPPRPCATSGCASAIPAHSKARYCDACAGDRQRRRVHARRHGQRAT
jgi:hypothetical protein